MAHRYRRAVGSSPFAGLEAYRTIKVPQWVYADLKQATAKMQSSAVMVAPRRPALDPQVLAPRECPVCRSEMKELSAGLKYEYRHCGQCGYTAQDLTATASANFFGGVVIGVGLTLLLKMLADSGGSKPPARRRPTRKTNR